MKEGITGIESVEKENLFKIYEFKDIDGDENIAIDVEDYVVFASKDMTKWSVSFALKSDNLDGADWMNTLTNRGAFKTMRLLKPALGEIINEIERRGDDWMCNTDSRRANLYRRYLPENKINITDSK